MQRATNFSEGTNSKFPWIYIGSVQAFLKNWRLSPDDKCQNHFYARGLKN